MLGVSGNPHHYTLPYNPEPGGQIKAQRLVGEWHLGRNHIRTWLFLEALGLGFLLRLRV